MKTTRGHSRTIWLILAMALLAAALLSVGAPAVYAQDGDGGDPPVVVDDPGGAEDDGEPTAITLQGLEAAGAGMLPVGLLVAGLGLAGLTLFALTLRRAEGDGPRQQ